MTNPTGQKTVFGDRPYLVLNHQGQTLPPLLLTSNMHRLGRDRQRADLVVPDDWRVLSGCHATLRQAGGDYHIYDGDGQQPSTNGLFINFTRITTTEGYPLRDGVEIQLGSNPQNQAILTYVNPAAAQATPPRQNSVSLKNKSVLIGRDAQASLTLDSPIVSRRHASIEPDRRGSYILQDYSTNGVFVNQQRVSGSMLLPPGASIQIGPYTLILQGDSLVVADRGDQIRLDVYHVVREVRAKGGRKRLLDDISLAIEPGQFVALVGGSGAGKSTLMRSLLGIEPINQGQVNLNGQNLRANFNIYRTQIGYVPQDDIIHRELRVGEVLTYAAKLRLPPDLNVQQVVDRTLNQIEMSGRKDVLVSQLSGGQRKRVSIGVELLADPKLFFLDEPTSGLDPGLDKKMMQLLRKLANEGRTVILVTHATANVNLCDRIVFMGAGGRLCYFGPPQEAMSFFNIKTGDFADLYNLLDSDQNVVQEALKFRQSPQYQRYITNHLSEIHQPASGGGSRPQIGKSSRLGQLILLIRRSLKITLRDRIYLTLSLFTAPIAIVLIRIALKSKDALAPVLQNNANDAFFATSALRVVFVFACAALWVGLSSAVQEIVKESAIYIRERLVNLGLVPYVASKMFLLGGLAILQAIFMVAVILFTFTSPSPDLISWELGAGIATFLTLTASFSLGLFISAIVKNSSQANSTLPLILLPQIIFSGVLFDIKDNLSRVASWLTISRWSVGAFGSLVDINSMVPKRNGQPLPGLPFKGDDVYNATAGNITLNLGVLLLHTVVYLILTLIIQKRKDVI
ncbi:ATP-binding cassette domain-containing protein [Merismopedia glauca]|uniref:Maltooligosyl trehalose synthase n=1 Tax=Merismopedia glauca CCAP 1448/3 TaxID=1296344 RepID=A0A2T1C9P4_9CYAN|nr:ATP-binding cassette domain-containing protein [Merismopedia glauca]PSB04863.1 maltooligosyl trehalose synthase [Merismopedia glauca CCAP 1448/3]